MTVLLANSTPSHTHKATKSRSSCSQIASRDGGCLYYSLSSSTMMTGTVGVGIMTPEPGGVVMVMVKSSCGSSRAGSSTMGMVTH